MNYEIQENRVSTPWGVSLYYRRYTANISGPTIIVVHGLGEHSGRYEHLMEYFDGTGISFFLFDNRGHGKSTGPRGHVSGFHEYLDDLGFFVRMVREEQKEGEDIFLLGHSMGGVIVANYLIQRDAFFTGAVLSGPAFRPGAKIHFLKKKAGNIFSRYLPAFSMRTGLNPDHLSHDSRVIREYKSDNLVHKKASARWYTSFIAAGEFAVQQAGAISCPLLILHGGDDMLAALSGSEEFFLNVRAKESELRVFDGFFHEIFNELEKEKVFQAMAGWMAKIREMEKQKLVYLH